MLVIEPASEKEMIQDALNSFPNECCGFFFGDESDENRTIKQIMIVNNAKEGDKTRKFEISGKDYLHAEKIAEELNLQLLGIYHSHPNHPAIPSEDDRLAAQPYFSYIIISVSENEFLDIRAWRLNDEIKFEEENITDPVLINQKK